MCVLCVCEFSSVQGCDTEGLNSLFYKYTYFRVYPPLCDLRVEHLVDKIQHGTFHTCVRSGVVRYNYLCTGMRC